MRRGAAGLRSRARSHRETYAGRCTRVGEIGAGQTTKLFNQMICGITFVAVAEVATLAARAGVDAAAIPAALADGRANSRILQEYMPRMARHDRTRSGRIDTMLKDLEAVAELADRMAPSSRVPSLLQRCIESSSSADLEPRTRRRSSISSNDRFCPSFTIVHAYEHADALVTPIHSRLLITPQTEKESCHSAPNFEISQNFACIKSATARRSVGTIFVAGDLARPRSA